MQTKYSQFRATMAITKASLRALLRSPQGVFFSLFFPVVLIWIFGALGGGGTPTVDVAFAKGTDTTNAVYQRLKLVNVLDISKNDEQLNEENLSKGRITAIISLSTQKDSIKGYQLNLKTSSASQKDLPLLQGILKNVITDLSNENNPSKKSAAYITQETIPGREYKRIDFYLPGMIGFSLIGATIFGVAFAFFSLRETLVLKRMYSTPVAKRNILIGEGIARVAFQLLTVIVLILFGYYAYGFTLAHGFTTALEMLALSFFGLIVFMGFGFLISSISKNQNVIPVYANLIMFPQYFLSGTFFPKSALPAGMQSIIKYLPLTAINDAMRNVAFEGASLVSCWPQLAILTVWGIVMYALAAKFFKWDN